MSAKSEEPSRGRLLAPLRLPLYRYILASNSLWWLALWMEMIVIGWLVLEMTNSAWQVSLVGFYRMAPLLILGIFSGTLIDRIGRRTILLVTNSVAVIVQAAIATLLWMDRVEIWHLAVGATVLGIVWTLDWTARRTLLPDLVGRTRLLDAMILEGVLQNLTRIMGPLAAGALIAAFGASGCYILLTLISFLALLGLLRLPRQIVPTEKGPDAPSPWAASKEGIRYVRNNPTILGVCLITISMNYFLFPTMTLLPVFARDILGQGPIGLGMLGATAGAGSFLGLGLVNHLRHRIRITWIYAWGSSFMALCYIGFALSTDFDLSLALLFISGVGHASFGILQSSIVLLTARKKMRSRAMGAITLGIGTGPPGRLQVGALADRFGAPLCVAGTCSVAVVLVIAVWSLLPNFRKATGDTEDVEIGDEKMAAN